MVDPNKQYRTRNGLEVRIYAVDAGGRLPVHAATKREEGWVQDEWTQAGSYNGEKDGHAIPHDLDLIEVKPRIKREVWVNVYPDCISEYTYNNKAHADCDAIKTRIACVKLTIDCEEGEGL
jgi:hypothetical protein